ncbi:hypothetical protein [Lentzea guizhouensis]|uniref:hypothetical protein n=1 Tax=Lentzea guizhouensis TaxID=1586287 RepID=UPI0012B69F52|nr:hypothetical protein [Lentzea guizhouensis]
MTSLPVPRLAASSHAGLPALPHLSALRHLPALPHVPSTARLRTPGISPPTPWRPHPWRRWFPWWWFQ